MTRSAGFHPAGRRSANLMFRERWENSPCLPVEDRFRPPASRETYLKLSFATGRSESMSDRSRRSPDFGGD